MTTLLHLAVDDLAVDPVNPRKSLAASDVHELAVSILRQGVLEPLLVRPTPAGGWWVTSGQTRLRAAVHAGLETVPCIVRDDLTDDTAALLAALTSNTSSTPMCPTDEARAYERLVTAGMTQTAVAEACGVSPSRVSMLLKLLTLDHDLQAAVDDGTVGLQTAVRRHQRRYASGHGVPRGKAALAAREAGPQTVVHLMPAAAASLLGVQADTVRYRIGRGTLEVDPVSGGIPLHVIARMLAAERTRDVPLYARPSAGRRRTAGDEVIAIRRDLWAELTRRAALHGATVDDVLLSLVSATRRAA